MANEKSLFQNKSPKCVLVLGKTTPTVRGIQTFLQNKGLKTLIVNSVNDLSLNIDLHRPVFILASDQINQAPSSKIFSYLKRKYKIPIIPFQDQILKRELTNKTALLPDDSSKVAKESEKADEVEIQSLATNLFENMKAQIDSNSNEIVTERTGQGQDPSIAEVQGLVVDFFNSNAQRVFLNLPQDSELQVLSLKMVAGQENGFFVFAIPPEKQSSPQEVFEKLKGLIRKAMGEHIQLEESQQFISYELFREMKSNSEFSIEGIVNNQEFLFSVFEKSTPTNSQETFLEQCSLFSIPMEEWWTRIPLPFNSFLWFEKNKKKLLYVRSGESFRPEIFQRSLDSKNRAAIKTICIEPSDFEKYLQLRELILAARVG